MRRIDCITRAVLCLAIAAGASVAIAAEPATHDASAATTTDAAGLWRQVLEHGELSLIDPTYVLEGDLYTKEGTIDADACKARASAIDAALIANPVGLGVWYAAYQCALALGDEAAAALRLERFGALVRYAVESRPPDMEQTPIRILSERDVEAFVKASGQTVLYTYYEPFASGRYLPLRVSLWDAERSHERLLSFDFVDSRLRLNRSSTYAEFPHFRSLVIDQFLEASAANPESAAAPAVAMRKAVKDKDQAGRTAALAALAPTDLAVAINFASWCLVIPMSDCAEHAVDALLPWAEKSYSVPLVLLAFAYERGDGVKRDQRNAATLLDAANRRLGNHQGDLLFVSYAVRRAGTEGLDSFARERLTKLVAEHQPQAELLAVNSDLTQYRGKPLTADKLALLRHAAEAHLPSAESLLAIYLADHGDTSGIEFIRPPGGGAMIMTQKAKTDTARQSEAQHWSEVAAHSGDPLSQRYLAQAYEKGGVREANHELARKWYGEAGRGGDIASMLWMARDYRAQPASAQTRKRAQGWLLSATMLGNVDGALALADLWVDGGDGVEGDANKAAQIYRELDKQHDNAEARRSLAELLTASDVVTHDPVEARRLLKVDADRGDALSRTMLGRMMTRGAFGEEEFDAGRRLLEEGANKGDATAMLELGVALYYARKPPDRSLAISWWQRAADAGNLQAKNNVAWALCTSPEAALRDGARGLQIAQSLTKDGDAPIAFVDTEAACFAASGDFERAQQTEAGAIESAKKNAPRTDSFIKNANERIDLFRSRRLYVEEPAKG